MDWDWAAGRSLSRSGAPGVNPPTGNVGASALNRSRMCRVEPALPQVLETGTFVGPYEVIARLGLGGMGQVFLARDSRLQRKVALKYLTSQMSGEQTQATILREARAAARINHPNIAAVHDIFDDHGR